MQADPTGRENVSLARKISDQSTTEAEWTTRRDLAALHRIADHLGWIDLVYGHISARVPGEPNHFLIKAFGDMFHEVTASSLVKMDLDGNTLTPGSKTNKAGSIIHAGVYKARPDANCAIHTHTRATAGISLVANGLRPISQDSMHVLDDLAYHPYGIPASEEECEELGKACAHASCIVLMNHGSLTHGPTIHGTLLRQYLLEHACEFELIARTLNVEPVPIAESVVKAAEKYMRSVRNTPEYGLMEFEALVRVVEQKGGTDYRS